MGATLRLDLPTTPDHAHTYGPLQFCNHIEDVVRGAGPPGRPGHRLVRQRLPGRYQGLNTSDLFGYEGLGRARTCIRSPCCPNRLMNSTGLPSALANQ